MQFAVENQADVMNFDHYVPPELTEIIVYQTNLYAQQQIAKMPCPVAKHACSEQWKPVRVIEMKKFLGLIFVTGIVRKPKLELYWSTRGFFRLRYFHKQCLGTDFNLFKSTFTSMTVMQQEQTKIICTKSIQFWTLL